MNKKILKATLLLGLIFLLGLFLRLYRLNLNIPPLYADETGQYYLLPAIYSGTLNFIQYIIHYFITFTWFLGLTPLGARLPSAVYGALLVVAVYYLGLEISKGNKKVALTFSALVAVLPWSYMLSRIGHSPIQISLVLVCFHALLYLRSDKILHYLLSFIPLGVSLLFYPAVLLTLPFVFAHFIFIIYGILDPKYRRLFLSSFFAVVLCLGTLYAVKYNLFSRTNRGLDMAIWNDINTPWKTDKYRALSWNSEPTLFSFGLPPEQLANKLVYNRAMANITTFTKNYLSFFSPDWLFIKGDAILRHSTGQVGEFYPFLIPFMLYGAFAFLSTASKKNKIIFLTWILASPIPAAITKDGAGYLLRAVTMLPFLTYFCALGIVESFNLIKGKWRIPYGILIAMIGFYSAYYFFYGYFHVYPSLSARSYEYGFKELSDFQVANQNAPMLVIWDGYYHNNDFRFWQATPFDQYNSFKIYEQVIGDSHFHQTFPNLYFVNPKSAKDVLEFIKQNLVDFVVLPDRYFVNYPVELDTKFGSPYAVILYPDKTPALQIFTVKR